MIVYVGSDIERGIQALKTAVAKDGILRELKAKRYFLSPSEKKKLKHRLAITRLKRMEKRRRTT